MDGMFKVTEEQTMLRDLVKKFVRNELMPLEKNILERFASGQPAALSDEESKKLFKQCKDLGLWALDVPEEAGGANLPAVALVGVNEELGYTCVPFTFPPDSPNLHMMLATTLSLDGSKDEEKGWRDVGKGGDAPATSADLFDYVCHGKIYRFEETYDGNTM